MEILASASKHGVSDDDIRHAVANAITAITNPEQPDFVMLIGPGCTAELLEIGVLSTDETDFVIHAMPARAKYLHRITPPPR